MSYSQQTINNKSLIKKYSHKKRFDVAVKLIGLQANDSYLDFGTGDGYLLTRLANHHPKNYITGYEPVETMFSELTQTMNSLNSTTILIVNNLDKLQPNSFEVVSCLEVLEHFSEKNQKMLIEQIKTLVSENGKMVISVPLEIGLTALLKNTIRAIVKQKHSGTSFSKVLKATFGITTKRNQEGYIHSHIGFNHNHLEKVFKDCQLTVIKKHYSPFKFLYGILNAQVYYILKK